MPYEPSAHVSAAIITNFILKAVYE